jgi:hypothetical protein
MIYVWYMYEKEEENETEDKYEKALPCHRPLYKARDLG